MTGPVASDPGVLVGLPAPAPARRAARRAGSGKLLVGGSIVALFVLLAVLAPLIRPADPLAQNIADALQPPSGAHLLGTDELGRDVLSRVLTATGLNLFIALAGTLLPCLLGTALGVLAGYLGGWVDGVVMRVSDLLQAFPTYILMIVLVFAMGPGVGSLLVAFTVVGWVVYARLVRAEVVRTREAGYVTAAVLGGLSTPRVIVGQVLPTSLRQTILYFSSDLVFAVTALAAFSFLGFGIQPPTPEWGSMIAAAQPYLAVAPWLVVVPGVMITLLALGLALLGDGVQDRMAAR